MAKANQQVYHGGVFPQQSTSKGEPLINPINRRGQPALGSRNTGHPKERPTNQSRQDYDNQVRGVK